VKKLRLKKFKLQGLRGAKGLRGSRPLTGSKPLTGQKAKKIGQYP
jgi:hypothetical protein